MRKNLPFEKDAQTLLSQGHFKQALIVTTKWVEAREKDSFAWFCKSVAEMALSKPKIALVSVNHAIELEPGNVRYMAHRARCLIGAGDVTEGLSVARELAVQEDRNPHLLDDVATTLAMAGEITEALPLIECAIELNPKVAQFHTNHASMLSHSGRAAESEVAHRKALELQPDDFQAYWLLSQIKKATPNENYVDWFKGVLQTYKDRVSARVGINYALGKQLEDMGQYDEAFECYQSGAAAMLEHTEHTPGVVEIQFEKYRSIFDSELFAVAGDACDNDEAILIVGMPRTGTTLVERIIASYDEVFAAGELHNFGRLFHDHCYRLNPGARGIEIYDNAGRLDFEELGRAYIGSTRPRTGHTKYFIDKYPFNFQLIGPFARALPKARIICLNRNPMDTCLSNFKFLFTPGSATYSYDLKSLAHFYAQYRSLMEHWHECLPGRILDVDYDHLVQNPEEGARRITDFLGFDWDPACLDFHQAGGVVATGSAQQIRDPVNTTYLHKWKKFEAHLDTLKAALDDNGIRAD